MRKIISLILGLAMCLGLTACGEDTEQIAVVVPQYLFVDISEEEISASADRVGFESCTFEDGNVRYTMTNEVRQNYMAQMKDVLLELSDEAQQEVSSIDEIVINEEFFGSEAIVYLNRDEITMDTYEAVGLLLFFGMQYQIFNEPEVDPANFAVFINFVNKDTGDLLLQTVTTNSDMEAERYFGLVEPVLIPEYPAQNPDELETYDGYVPEPEPDPFEDENIIDVADIERRKQEAENLELDDEFIAELKADLSAADVSGICGDDLFWYSIGDVLLITGTGAMYENQEYTYKDKCSPMVVVIDDGVTGIPSYGFCDMYDIVRVRLPESLTALGDAAFADCTSLVSIQIPSMITRLGQAAFAGCGRLRDVQFPDTLTEFGPECFVGAKFESFVIPDGCTEIPEQMFTSCTKLTSVTIPDSVTTIGRYAFRGCDILESIDLPNSITRIDEMAFSRCYALKSIVLPGALTVISDDMFEECSSLSSVIIPDSVQSIGAYSFGDCSSLKELRIPAGVTAINPSVFGNREDIGKLTVTYACPNEVVMDAMNANATCVWIRE